MNMNQLSPKLGTLKSKNNLWKKIIKQRELVFMSFPLIVFIIVFSYVPLWGWIMAFQRYRPGKSIFNQEWVGLDQFKMLFTDQAFFNVLRNTIVMSSINLVLGFITAIGLALLLNEIKNMFFKKTVQTISYLPHFISWVITAGIVQLALSPENGIINDLFMFLGIIKEPIMWLGVGGYFWAINGIVNVWKEVGWNSIIYLAAIAAIDPALYEAAAIDGAGRFKKMLYVTLPGIKSTFVILLIMNIGSIIASGGFDLQYLLRNGLISDYSDTIDVFVLQFGIGGGNFSFATAAGIFKSVVSIGLLLFANSIAKKIGEERLI